MVDTQGESRIASLRREAANSLPAVGAAVVLFVLAALVEGYVSASAAPYWAKASVAVLSVGAILAYLTLGGRGDDPDQGLYHSNFQPVHETVPTSTLTGAVDVRPIANG